MGHAMRDSRQIAEFVEERIGHIYRRPLMYGGTPDGVDLILHYYHELWAEIHQRRGDYEQASSEAHEAERCGSMDFSTRYRRERPDASEGEAAAYVVSMWRKIDEKLGLAVDGAID